MPSPKINKKRKHKKLFISHDGEALREDGNSGYYKPIYEKKVGSLNELEDISTLTPEVLIEFRGGGD